MSSTALAAGNFGPKFGPRSYRFRYKVKVLHMSRPVLYPYGLDPQLARELNS